MTDFMRKLSFLANLKRILSIMIIILYANISRKIPKITNIDKEFNASERAFRSIELKNESMKSSLIIVKRNQFNDDAAQIYGSKTNNTNMGSST